MRIKATGDYAAGKAGKVTDVAISYPRDFLAQQLAWARENGTLGF